jgi:uncharacterized protein (TIGR02231 family)
MQFFKLVDVALASLSLFPIFAGDAFAREIETKSAISAVTVYPDAASVTREATVELPAGESTVLFTGLPYAALPDSFRASGEAQAPLAIGAVEARVSPARGKAADSAIDARLNDLRAARAGVEVTIEALKAKQAMILRYAQASPEGRATETQPLPVSEWTKAFDAIGAAYANAGEELRVAGAKAHELDEEIRGLEGGGGSLKDGRARDIAVGVESRSGGRAKLTLTYQTRGASWKPSYEARLDTGDKDRKTTLELLRLAVVTQDTGEDWRDVALSVSTVHAHGGAAAPEVFPQRVAFLEAMPVAAPMARAKNAPMMAGAGAQRGEEADGLAYAPAKPATAELEASAYAATFRITGSGSALGDGSPKSFLLSSRTLEPKLTIHTAPALDPTAYLEARVVNAEDAPLLPGVLSVQRDGAFVGSSRIALTAPGEAANFGFGADDKVKVSRVPVKRSENEPTWFGQTKADTREFKTSMKNLHVFPVSVSVVDQVPFSENTAIIVETLPHTTPPSEKQPGDKRGVLAWNFDLQPGESKDIHLAYRLKWPADREIIVQPAPLAR